jgi:hypothetical protein
MLLNTVLDADFCSHLQEGRRKAHGPRGTEQHGWAWKVNTHGPTAGAPPPALPALFVQKLADVGSDSLGKSLQSPSSLSTLPRLYPVLSHTARRPATRPGGTLRSANKAGLRQSASREPGQHPAHPVQGSGTDQPVIHLQSHRQ